MAFDIKRDHMLWNYSIFRIKYELAIRFTEHNFVPLWLIFIVVVFLDSLSKRLYTSLFGSLYIQIFIFHFVYFSLWRVNIHASWPKIQFRSIKTRCLFLGAKKRKIWVYWSQYSSSVLCTCIRLCMGAPYTRCIKKTELIWNFSQFRKTAISLQFLIYSFVGYL
jgi:hypothetical protein